MDKGYMMKLRNGARQLLMILYSVILRIVESDMKWLNEISLELRKYVKIQIQTIFKWENVFPAKITLKALKDCHLIP